MNTTLKLYAYDFLATFSLLTHKIEYDKVHNQRVKNIILIVVQGFYQEILNLT